ncbi:hypothetical protein BC940DRAFT_337423 [Gongronella butleri]|nr:hypothetical protein BC940DRAFT_337423 [Gongronella butleri]
METTYQDIPLQSMSLTRQYPSADEFEQIMQQYLTNLSLKKRDKALIDQERYNLILRVLQEPKNTAISTAQFRFWVKKMFTLTTLPSGRLAVCHDHKPVAMKEQIYSILIWAHRQSHHGGRDKTSTLVRKRFSWIPKELIARFVRQCPFCITRRNGHADMFPAAYESPMSPHMSLSSSPSPAANSCYLVVPSNSTSSSSLPSRTSLASPMTDELSSFSPSSPPHQAPPPELLPADLVYVMPSPSSDSVHPAAAAAAVVSAQLTPWHSYPPNQPQQQAPEDPFAPCSCTLAPYVSGATTTTTTTATSSSQQQQQQPQHLTYANHPYFYAVTPTPAANGTHALLTAHPSPEELFQDDELAPSHSSSTSGSFSYTPMSTSSSSSSVSMPAPAMPIDFYAGQAAHHVPCASSSPFLHSPTSPLSPTCDYTTPEIKKDENNHQISPFPSIYFF